MDRCYISNLITNYLGNPLLSTPTIVRGYESYPPPSYIPRSMLTRQARLEMAAGRRTEPSCTPPDEIIVAQEARIETETVERPGPSYISLNEIVAVPLNPETDFELESLPPSQ